MARGIRWIASAGLEQVADLGLELLLEGPQVGDSRAGGEEHVAQAAAPCGDLLPPLTSVSWSMPKRVENRS